MKPSAYLKYLHISPKKIKFLGSSIVGLSPQEAIDRLLLVGNKSSRILAATVNSALANAKNNLKLDTATLQIKTLEVLKGPFLKRWQPVSRGTAHQIKKRTAHVRIILEEKKHNIQAVKSVETERRKEKVERSKGGTKNQS